MQYNNSSIVKTEQFSIAETLQELSDVIAIAKATIETGDTKLALANLSAAEQYIAHIKRKIDTALKHVPKDVQEKEFL